MHGEFGITLFMGKDYLCQVEDGVLLAATVLRFGWRKGSQAALLLNVENWAGAWPFQFNVMGGLASWFSNRGMKHVQ